MKASAYRPLPPTFWQQLTAPLRKALGMPEAKTRYYDERLGVTWTSLPKPARPYLAPKYDHYQANYTIDGHKEIVMRRLHGKPKADSTYAAVLQAPDYMPPKRRR